MAPAITPVMPKNTKSVTGIWKPVNALIAVANKNPAILPTMSNGV